MSNSKKGPWHGLVLHMDNGGFDTPVPYHPLTPEANALILAGDCTSGLAGVVGVVGVMELCERVCRLQDTLRDNGQPDFPIEIQITRAQLRQLQRDPLYPDSVDCPLAYPYPDAPHKNKLYFYGVMMRKIAEVEDTSTMRLMQLKEQQVATKKWAAVKRAYGDFNRVHENTTNNKA